jgi:CspA family cold shock protein
MGIGAFRMGGKESPLLEGNIDRDNGVTNDNVAVDVFQVSGSVRWFDPSKGYGFLVPDQDLPDVLMHVTCLRRDGFQTAHEGARIVCDVVRTAKGLQAFRIHAMDNSTAIHPSQLPQPTHVVVPESDWEKATVKWFNRARGFGFLTRGPHTADIFVHVEMLKRCGFIGLRSGQTVLVRHGRGPDGLTVAELKVDNTAGPTSNS